MRVQLVLAEVLGHEFNATLHDGQPVADVCVMRGSIYAFEIASTSAHDVTTTADDADKFIDVIALSCSVKKAKRLIFYFTFNL